MNRLILKTLTLMMCGILLLPPGSPFLKASSHREAPAITLDPAADNTDVYAFRSTEAGREDFVTLISNFIPLQDPSGGPNFHKFDPNVLYEIMIDNDGDAFEDVTYQFRFSTEILNPNTFLTSVGPINDLMDPNYNVRQLFSVARVLGDRRTGMVEVLATDLIVPPPNIGPASTPNYEELATAAIYDLPDGSRVFAGPREEGFYVDLGAVFDLLQLRPSEEAVDGTAGKNVHSIAIEVPVSSLTSDGGVPGSTDDPNAVIGVWSTASRPTFLSQFAITLFGGSAFRQVSRLGMPLVNEVVIPLADKDLFNVSEPSSDGLFLDYVLDPEVPRLFTALFGFAVPEAPRNDLVQVFLTGIPGLTQPPNVVGSEMLRLNMGVPPTSPESQDRLGVLAGDLAGFPNGRRVGDDVVDIVLRAAAGVLVDGFNVAPNNGLADGVDENDVPYLTSFPYLATPHAGKVQATPLVNNISPEVFSVEKPP